MNKSVKSVVAVIAVVTVYLGFHYAVDFDSNDASLFTLPNFNTTLTTDSSSDIDTNTAAETRSNRASVGTLHEFNDAIVDIAERTNPTVVTITTQQTVRQRMRSPFSLFFDDPRYDQEREFQRSGLGSGVIVSEDGYIITNNHVIQDADEILIQFYDGEQLEGEVVGSDPDSDVAVLRVNSSDLLAITIGDSDDLRVGELVLAIGSPLQQQFAHSVSMGVVSAKGRANLGLSAYENYIQTDAAINPGNSGGALINMDGELVGINTAIASRTGGNQGIGFAIPINMARMVMESLIEDGRVVRSYLGIGQGAMVDNIMARALDLDVNYGVVVGDVPEGGPADKAGIVAGDVILSKDGRPIRDWAQFRLSIANAEPGTEIELEIFREGERRTLNVTLEERPSEEQLSEVGDDEIENLREELGFSVSNLTDNIRSQLNLQSGVEGVIVSDVQQGSRAYRQGIRPRDVITQIQNQVVTSESEFYSLVASLKSAGQDVMLMRVNRGGNNVFIALEL